jgi:hypothetical protein
MPWRVWRRCKELKFADISFSSGILFMKIIDGKMVDDQMLKMAETLSGSDMDKTLELMGVVDQCTSLSRPII